MPMHSPSQPGARPTLLAPSPPARPIVRACVSRPRRASTIAYSPKTIARPAEPVDWTSVTVSEEYETATQAGMASTEASPKTTEAAARGFPALGRLLLLVWAANCGRRCRASDD